MKKIVVLLAAASLAITGAYAIAEGAYSATEAGYVTDTDGRVYSYVIYGIDSESANRVRTDSADVLTNATDVNTDSRRPPAASDMRPDYGTAIHTFNDTGARGSTVFVKAADVNDVLGRA